MEGRRSNRRWHTSSALKFKGLLWWLKHGDLRFTNVSKMVLKRLSVSNGSPVFLFVSGS